jgi:hypothetical protein
MVSTALRKIEAELLKLADDPDHINHWTIRTIAIRVGAQAEMLEEGIAE